MDTAILFLPERMASNKANSIFNTIRGILHTQLNLNIVIQNLQNSQPIYEQITSIKNALVFASI
ncbi:MAG TPA: hypothetical protein PKV46_02400, partial [Candidatus Marinimicrobia bacterium]|nr:hypothetical protein [Candidatus Neomarinimicrobiota bacterium]